MTYALMWPLKIFIILLLYLKKRYPVRYTIKFLVHDTIDNSISMFGNAEVIQQ